MIYGSIIKLNKCLIIICKCNVLSLCISKVYNTVMYVDIHMLFSSESQLLSIYLHTSNPMRVLCLHCRVLVLPSAVIPCSLRHYVMLKMLQVMVNIFLLPITMTNNGCHVCSYLSLENLHIM